MVCDWCRIEHFDPLGHVCADGSTLEDRRRYLEAGIEPPKDLVRGESETLKAARRALNTMSKKDDTFLNLTPEDTDLLIGMKIRW